VLAVVSWNMVEREAIGTLARVSRIDLLVLVVIFLLVVFRGLTEGILVGFALGGLVFIRRMSEAAGIECDTEAPDIEDPHSADRVAVHLHGPFFFGAPAHRRVLAGVGLGDDRTEYLAPKTRGGTGVQDDSTLVAGRPAAASQALRQSG
jgi:MFS superfamily sulfate permease-like transporter